MKKTVLCCMTLLGSCMLFSCSKNNEIVPEKNDVTVSQTHSSVKGERGVEFDPNGAPKTSSVKDSSISKARGNMDPNGSVTRSRGTMDPDGKPIK